MAISGIYDHCVLIGGTMDHDSLLNIERSATTIVYNVYLSMDGLLFFCIDL